MKRFILLLFSISSVLTAQDTNRLMKILETEEQYFDTLILNPDYEIQIIYTQIDRDENNKPNFTTYKVNVDKNNYFYPASSVKFPACILTINKINELNIHGLTIDTPLKIDSNFSGQTKVEVDSTSKNFLPSLSNYIKKVFLVSDNDAFNRLYEFLGQEYINKTLWQKGFSDTKISHRLSVSMSELENRHTNKFVFYSGENIIYEQPAQFSEIAFSFPKLIKLKKGIGYFANNKLINEPKDFSGLNYFSLENQHELLKTIIFPEFIDAKQKFNLTFSDYDFIYKYMGMLPRESNYPNYKDEEHYDSYVKFFIYGDSKEPIPSNVRILNKVGLAYGYVIDNAYILDFKNNVEFMLSAVIHVNKDKIFNDDKYEYEETAFPFFSKLGKAVYNYELKRERKFPPNLSHLEKLFKD